LRQGRGETGGKKGNLTTDGYSSDDLVRVPLSLADLHMYLIKINRSVNLSVKIIRPGT